jgi:hypothetical protein
VLSPIFDRDDFFGGFAAANACILTFAFALDAMPEPSVDFVSAPAHASLESHQLVFQTETRSTAAAKEAEWKTRQGAALVGLPS